MVTVPVGAFATVVVGPAAVVAEPAIVVGLADFLLELPHAATNTAPATAAAQAFFRLIATVLCFVAAYPC
jgi:hypothetical protein